MKVRFLTLGILCCFFLYAQAQQRQPGEAVARPAYLLSNGELQFRADMDTLIAPALSLPCADVAFTVRSDGWGFVGGTNNYGDKEKAQRLGFTGADNYRVTEVWGYFEEPSVVNDGIIFAKIYAVNPTTGAPAALLGQSGSIKVSDLRSDPTVLLPTIFTFSTPVAVNADSFFVSFDISNLYTTRDTVTLFVTDDDCGNGRDAYDKFSDDSWEAFNSSNSWGLNSNFFVVAVVEFDNPTGVTDPFVEREGLRLSPARPNPAAEQVQLPYYLREGGAVTLEVFGSDGRLLHREVAGNRPAGEHYWLLPTAGWAPGTYFYAVRTDRTRSMSRFLVSH